MPDTILIHEYDPSDEIEVITKFDLDDDIPEDELNESAEFYLDELLMEEGAEAHEAIKGLHPEHLVAAQMFRRIIDTTVPKKQSDKHVTADTIETLINLEECLQSDDGSDLQFLMDTLTGKE
jgi:hypothetical protein